MGGNNRQKSKKAAQCCCEKHQLTVLVISMTIVLFLTIVYCVYCVHSKLLKIKIVLIMFLMILTKILTWSRKEFKFKLNSGLKIKKSSKILIKNVDWFKVVLRGGDS